MAIVSLSKVTIYGAQSQKDDAIRRLQELGCVHLVNLGESDIDREHAVAVEARAALAYLRACPKPLEQVVSTQAFELEKIVDDALAL